MCWSVHLCALTPHTCVLVAHSLALPREVALELSQPVVSGVSQSSSPCPLVFGTEPEGQAGLQFVCLWHLVLSPRVAVEKPGPRSCGLSPSPSGKHLQLCDLRLATVPLWARLCGC